MTVFWKWSQQGWAFILLLCHMQHSVQFSWTLVPFFPSGLLWQVWTVVLGQEQTGRSMRSDRVQVNAGVLWLQWEGSLTPGLLPAVGSIQARHIMGCGQHFYQGELLNRVALQECAVLWVFGPTNQNREAGSDGMYQTCYLFNYPAIFCYRAAFSILICPTNESWNERVFSPNGQDLYLYLVVSNTKPI